MFILDLRNAVTADEKLEAFDALVTLATSSSYSDWDDRELLIDEAEQFLEDHAPWLIPYAHGIIIRRLMDRLDLGLPTETEPMVERAIS